MENAVAVAPLKAFFERAERLEAEKVELDEALKALFAEVKAQGYDVAIFKEGLKVRRQDPGQRAEKASLLSLYLDAAGGA